MAVGHDGYDRNTPYGLALYQALSKLEDGRDEYLQIVATLVQMKDAGSLTAYAVAKFGFADVTAATSALAELESAKGALDTAAAALDQMFNKLRSG